VKRVFTALIVGYATILFAVAQSPRADSSRIEAVAAFQAITPVLHHPRCLVCQQHLAQNYLDRFHVRIFDNSDVPQRMPGSRAHLGAGCRCVQLAPSNESMPLVEHNESSALRPTVYR